MRRLGLEEGREKEKLVLGGWEVVLGGWEVVLGGWDVGCECLLGGCFSFFFGQKILGV